MIHNILEPETNAIRENLLSFLECNSGFTGQALVYKVLGFVRSI